MLLAASSRYIANFRGFSREIWILAAMTFINRAGAMVLPFLSKYLHEDLHFSLPQVGTIMMCFGAGSMLGSFLGGKLTDKLGFYKIMVFSLFTCGLCLIALERIHSFAGLCIGMFLTMTIADMFRPALFVSISSYSTPETRTRALSLLRLAMNLGFALGPALAGLIIMGIGYSGLFWIDGASCILAILVFALLVGEKRAESASATTVGTDVRTLRNDKLYWVFLLVAFLGALTFFQILSTFPLYTRDGFGYSELETGLLMTLNGVLVFAFEMPIVGYLEKRHTDKLRIMLWGMVALALGYFALFWKGHAVALALCVIGLSFGEIFVFPFSNAFAVNRAPLHQKGMYMAYYTMAFSLAHIVGSKLGMEVVERFGYLANWVLMAFLALIGGVGCVWLRRRLSGS